MPFYYPKVVTVRARIPQVNNPANIIIIAIIFFSTIFLSQYQYRVYGQQCQVLFALAECQDGRRGPGAGSAVRWVRWAAVRVSNSLRVFYPI